MYRRVYSLLVGIGFAALCAAEGMRLEALQWRFIRGDNQTRVAQLGVTLQARYSPGVGSRAYQCYLVALGADSRGVPAGMLLARLIYLPMDVVDGRICALAQVQLPATVTRLYPLGATDVRRYGTLVDEMRVQPLPELEDLTFETFPNRKLTHFIPPTAQWDSSMTDGLTLDDYGPATAHTSFLALTSLRNLRRAEWVLTRLNYSWAALGMQRPKIQEAQLVTETKCAATPPTLTRQTVLAKRHFTPATAPRKAPGELQGLFRVDFGSRLQGILEPTPEDLQVNEETAWAFPIEKNLRALDEYYVLLTPKSQQVYAIWGMHTYPLAAEALSDHRSEPVQEFETLVDIMTRFYGQAPARSKRTGIYLAVWSFENATLAIQLRSGEEREARLVVLATDKALERIALAERTAQKEMEKEAIYLATDVDLLGGHVEAPPELPPAVSTPTHNTELVRYRMPLSSGERANTERLGDLLAFDRYPAPRYQERIDLPATFAPLTARNWTFDAAIDYRKQSGSLLLFTWGKERLAMALENSRVVLRLNNRVLEKVPLPPLETEALRLTLIYCQHKQGPRLYLYANTQRLWFETLPAVNSSGLSQLQIQAPLARKNNERNGLSAWALYRSPTAPNHLTAPQGLALPPPQDDTTPSETPPLSNP